MMNKARAKIARTTAALSYLLLATLLGSCMTAESAKPENARHAIKVEVVQENGRFQLMRGNKPYQVKGAGIEYADLEAFAANGGNSFRTWSIDGGPKSAAELLDHAHALGITVSLCLDIEPERSGFDYDDEVAVARQAEEARQQVLRYRDHPALLTWIIGNELNYDFKNPKVYDAVDDIAKIIHTLDPNHPVTTTLAGFDESSVQLVQQRASELDFLSFQLYGDLINLPEKISSMGFIGPYFVTEWGTVGHWEVGKTAWGAPIEPNSTAKADNYAQAYRTALLPNRDQLIGDYVFLWGQKQERTPTWYGMFVESGEATEAINVMHHIWQGKWPDNRSPQVSELKLHSQQAEDNVTLQAGASYPASLAVYDPDNDTLQYKWELRKESKATQTGGDREEIPELLDGLIDNPSSANISVKAPNDPGPYRLFVYVYDKQGHAAHANIPFLVMK